MRPEREASLELDHLNLFVADVARSRAFYEFALGGRDNGAPGLRAHYHDAYYAAFVLDPDGHNLEAVCHRSVVAD